MCAVRSNFGKDKGANLRATRRTRAIDLFLEVQLSHVLDATSLFYFRRIVHFENDTQKHVICERDVSCT